MSIKICPKCQAQHSLKGKFCSRACANSRGPRSNEFKEKVRGKLSGIKPSEEAILKGLATKGLRARFKDPNTICVICNSDTNTKHRKTCSDECFRKLTKLQSQSHPNCGGQKHTHRSKITNNRGDVFVAESSYEVLLSSILNIDWIRPDFVWYTDKNNQKRRYHPDFYLPEHGIYIDPKNDYLIKTDVDKILRASKENDIFIVILGVDYLTEEGVRSVVGDRGNAPLLPACKTGTLLLC